MQSKINNPVKAWFNPLSLILLMALLAFPALALGLKEAKQQGMVGEMSTGYLGAVVSNSEVNTLVKQVNDKRKKVYLNIARKNKLSLDEVAILAGKKALSKTTSGHYIKNANGKWVTK